MKMLYLVNHAESLGQGHPRHVDERSENSHLSEKGRMQAVTLGSWIHAHLPPLTEIISSTAQSSRETMKIAMNSAYHYSPEITEDERLAEMIGEGVDEKILNWALDMMHEEPVDNESRIPERAINAKRILVVTNSLAIRGLAGKIRKTDRREDIGSWQIVNASVNTFEFDDKGNPIRAMLNLQTGW